MRKYLVVLLSTTCLFASVGMAATQSETEQEVKQSIIERYEFLNTSLGDQPGLYSSQGALAFWSSGGLLQRIPPEEGQTESDYEAHSVQPKHIEVITLVEGEIAVALYYAEGSFKPMDSAPVSHYLVRATEVFVKEDGKWRVRASHWSPIAGGSGTSISTPVVQ